MQSPSVAASRNVCWAANATHSDLRRSCTQIDALILARNSRFVLTSRQLPMCALSRFTKPKPPLAEPSQAPPLELKGAQLAAASYGQRTGSDLHDYIRVGPERVLFALLDVA